MSTVEQICDTVGRKTLEERLGVKKAAVSNAISAGVFPPRWFRVVSELCEEHGQSCPADLFAFIEPNHIKAAE